MSEQSERDMRERAEELTARGVRRVIAVFVKRGEVREWSRDRNGWIVLPLDGMPLADLIDHGSDRRKSASVRQSRSTGLAP